MCSSERGALEEGAAISYVSVLYVKTSFIERGRSVRQRHDETQNIDVTNNSRCCESRGENMKCGLS